MCFFKDFNSDGCTIDYEHQTCDHDIKCYKVLHQYDNGVLHSIPHHFPYELGKTYEEKNVDLSLLDRLYELNGYVFHSYTDERYARSFRDTMVKKEGIVVVSCVIPAGTPFWRNDFHHEYASTKIRIDEIVE